MQWEKEAALPRRGVKFDTLGFQAHVKTGRRNQVGEKPLSSALTAQRGRR